MQTLSNVQNDDFGDTGPLNTLLPCQFRRTMRRKIIIYRLTALFCFNQSVTFLPYITRESLNHVSNYSNSLFTSGCCKWLQATIFTDKGRRLWSTSGVYSDPEFDNDDIWVNSWVNPWYKLAVSVHLQMTENKGTVSS